MNVLSIPGIYEKLKALDEALHALLLHKHDFKVPEAPARDVVIVAAADLPRKPGLSLIEGQARLLHDLASIELQAMELGVRTLIEFPDAPREFREELAMITRAEGEHLKLCLKEMREAGFEWGHWPAHKALWSATFESDDLIERILVVHRHLEGSGLDAGDSILRRLSGVASKAVRNAVNTIVSEEVGHVEFGSRWYREVCRLEGCDPDAEFKLRMPAIMKRTPRIEKIARDLRARAGFNELEMDLLDRLQVKSTVPTETKSETLIRA
jgi:uncharacterized ferritin-like protein (DUF455 family)